MESEQSFYEFLVKNNWQGTVNDFVFSTEVTPDQHDDKAEIEIISEEKPSVTELIIEDPDFLLCYEECTVVDGNGDEETLTLEVLNEDEVFYIGSLNIPKATFFFSNK